MEGLAKLLRLALNLRSSCLSLPNTGITSMCHQARLYHVFLMGDFCCCCWYWELNPGVFNSPILFFAVLGIEPRGILPLSYIPSPIFLFFISKQSLTKLWKASLISGSWDWPWTWNPPVSASLFLFFSVLGIEPRGILPPSYAPSPIFLFFISKQGLTKLQTASLSSWDCPQTCYPPVSISQVLWL